MTDPINLPAVASKHYAFCKKCDTDRYHTVLTHTNATTVKLKCEVCSKTSTVNFAPKKPNSGAARLAGAAAARKAQAESAKRTQYQQEYEALMSKEGISTGKYSMKGKFGLDTKIDHPKFGVGYIRHVQPDKIEVVFSDQVRLLIHNRP